MLEKHIQPLPHPLDACVRVPASKSLTNRALVIASLSKGRTRITPALFSDDTEFMIRALQELGFGIHVDETRCEISVGGLGGEIPAENAKLFTGNAGTAMRFLCALLTLGRGEYTLDGDDRMRSRPIGGLIDALTQLGVQIKASDNNCPPVKIQAAGLPGGKARIAGDVSSQYLSAVLMVAPYARQPIEISLSTELNSKPYVDLTLAMMQDFGVTVSREDYHSFSIPAGCYESKDIYPIESDASAASYFFAAPAICGGSIRVENISRQSKQGDLAFVDILRTMGCNVEEKCNSITVTGANKLHGIDVDLRDLPDTAQTLAVVAPFASSPTRIRGIASARYKETDRIHATCTELKRLGVQAEEHADGFTIHPCREFKPGVIQTYHDHRMAMAFSLIGLRVPGVIIAGPGCVSKTFPTFFEVLAGLSGSQVKPSLPTSLERPPTGIKTADKAKAQTSIYQLGLVGHPINHSLSPSIHRAALTAAGLQGEYALFPIRSDDLKGLFSLLQRMRVGEIHGLNVTIPHKVSVIPGLDELTATAEAIGAVNTIFINQGKLIGENTDAGGFLAGLEEFNCTQGMPQHPSALVLGAGGAARAVVYALSREGWKVTIAARRIEQASAIACQYGNVRCTELVFERLQGSDFQLIVNATPLGMAPQVDRSPWPEGVPLPPMAVVYDLVYAPCETRLIRNARAQGLQAIPGMRMLAAQAARAFEIWTGRTISTAILLESLNKLENREKP